MNRLLKAGIIITTAFIIVLSILIAIEWYQIKRREFLLEYIPPKAVDSLIKWTDYYDIHWLYGFSLMMTESEGDRMAVSPKDCKGYMMLARRTAQSLRDRLRTKCSNTDIFNTDFNIAGGILYLKDIYNNAGKNNILLTVELYNTGVYGYYELGKRAPNHVKRYSISYTFYKTEWRRYLIGR